MSCAASRSFRRSRRVHAAGIGAVLLTLTAIPCAAQGSDAARRLAAARTLPASELASRQAGFLAWLDSTTRLTPDDAQGAREYAYFLIGSIAQLHHARTGALFPPRDTMGLATLYDRASRLGEPGAALVANALRSPGAAPTKPIELMGGTLQLSFRAPEYTLTSSRGWSIRFPYWMMIGAAQTGVPKNGLSTETVVLSTLFAADSSARGQSQATIIINAAAAKDSAQFVPFWVGMLGMSEGDRVSGDSLVSYRQHDAEMHMYKEIAVRRRGDVVLVFAYAGLPGTFQANREEFIETVRSLAGAR